MLPQPFTHITLIFAHIPAPLGRDDALFCTVPSYFGAIPVAAILPRSTTLRLAKLDQLTRSSKRFVAFTIPFLSRAQGERLFGVLFERAFLAFLFERADGSF